MTDADNYGGWVVNGEECSDKYFKGRNMRAWNMHIRMKINSINIVVSAASVIL